MCISQADGITYLPALTMTEAPTIMSGYSSEAFEARLSNRDEHVSWLYKSAAFFFFLLFYVARANHPEPTYPSF